jgi:hypothetical protein
MSDSDPIKVSIKKKPDDLGSIIVDIASQIQFKFLGMMLVIFLFLSSDVFIGRVLSTFGGAVDFKTPTSYGVILQGLFLVLFMTLLDALIKQKII